MEPRRFCPVAGRKPYSDGNSQYAAAGKKRALNGKAEWTVQFSHILGKTLSLRLKTVFDDMAALTHDHFEKKPLEIWREWRTVRITGRGQMPGRYWGGKRRCGGWTPPASRQWLPRAWARPVSGHVRRALLPGAAVPDPALAGEAAGSENQDLPQQPDYITQNYMELFTISILHIISPVG